MKYIKRFQEHSLYEAYIVGDVFPETEGKPVVSYCKLQNEVHYNSYVPTYNLLDILYANTAGKKKVDSNVLDPSLGYTPIGICIAETGFFGENEPARFMSLKYMNYTTPETGSLTSQGMYWGNTGTDIHTIDNIQSENAFNDIDGKNKTIKILNTAISQSTWKTDTTIINESGAGYAPAACCCARYHTIGTNVDDWYLGAGGEMKQILVLYNNINTKLSQINAVYSTDCISSLVNSYHWSSTEYSANGVWCMDSGNNKIINNNKGYNLLTIALIQY